MRHATRFNKRDANEGDILKALARMGVEWIQAGPCDGWIFVGQFIPIEIKVPGGRLTESQEEFITACQQYGRPHAVWHSVKEAVESVNQWRAKA